MKIELQPEIAQTSAIRAAFRIGTIAAHRLDGDLSHNTSDTHVVGQTLRTVSVRPHW